MRVANVGGRAVLLWRWRLISVWAQPIGQALDYVVGQQRQIVGRVAFQWITKPCIYPPGVRMLWIRPAAAHRVTVFGSTRNRAATSPGVSSRSRGSIHSPWYLTATRYRVRAPRVLTHSEPLPGPAVL